MNDKPCILIVDDEPIIQQTLEALLPAEIYEVHHARDGAEGLAKAIALQPDAILLDIMLPRVDGLAVCRQLREHPLLAEVPILMITSLDDRATRLAGLEAGADDFLTKPFDTLELLARLKTITRLNRYRRLIEQRDRLARMNEELRAAYQQTIEGWSQALDLRDHETVGHTRRVTEMTVRLARLVRVDENSIEHIRRGAILHDIGKMGISDSILHKTGPLTEEEWKIMRQHPVYAYEWLSHIDYLRPALDIPYCHHEHWDGSGYPRGLKGEQIPLAARLFTLADVWDALRSDRPYRHAMPERDTLTYIETQKGLLFDPELTKIFIKNIRQII